MDRDFEKEMTLSTYRLDTKNLSRIEWYASIYERGFL